MLAGPVVTPAVATVPVVSVSMTTLTETVRWRRVEPRSIHPKCSDPFNVGTASPRGIFVWVALTRRELVASNHR